MLHVERQRSPLSTSLKIVMGLRYCSGVVLEGGECKIQEDLF